MHIAKRVSLLKMVLIWGLIAIVNSSIEVIASDQTAPTNSIDANAGQILSVPLKFAKRGMRVVLAPKTSRKEQALAKMTDEDRALFGSTQISIEERNLKTGLILIESHIDELTHRKSKFNEIILTEGKRVTLEKGNLVVGASAKPKTLLSVLKKLK
jgi:hypothetical protein